MSPGCCMYEPSRSPLYGMSTAQLQAALTAAQQAYVQLMTGGRVATVSYTQGDGQKSVTYQQTTMAALQAFIMELQSQLGLVCRARRPMRPWFI